MTDFLLKKKILKKVLKIMADRIKRNVDYKYISVNAKAQSVDKYKKYW